MMPEGAISPIFVGGLQESANATRNTMSPRFSSLREWSPAVDASVTVPSTTGKETQEIVDAGLNPGSLFLRSSLMYYSLGDERLRET